MLLGVFVTAFYSFRLVFMTFHGPERFRDAGACASTHHDTHDMDSAITDTTMHAAHDASHETVMVTTVTATAVRRMRVLGW